MVGTTGCQRVFGASGVPRVPGERGVLGASRALGVSGDVKKNLVEEVIVSMVKSENGVPSVEL